MKRLNAVLAGGCLLAAATFHAQAEDTNCATVKLADPGWSDIAVTNGIATFLLDGMGYQTKVDTLAVPIIFGGLKDGLVDAFLGNWMPAQQSYHDKFVANGDVEQLAKNLEGTEFTLAVPTYVWEAGVKDFADLNKFADRFNQKIYGIGSGAPANQSLQQIIAKNEFDLGKWRLVESGEQAMLSEVSRAVKRQRFIVFLGWTPHPMNVQIGMRYLKGGEAYFGSSGSVYTLTRKGYQQACPNAARLLANLSFTQEMENSIMASALEKKGSNAEAVKAWIAAHPEVLDQWLKGVTTRDGGEALAAVKAKL
ncbi:choline ABC transporter substrate-binding protein [Pseudomonas indica]|uniref:choline ABC transporter substrate-binding protein n=1 Tax=Pseudomonas indica TaxID=137658 RepID=UPI000BABE97F|nr:choline ABC transporter substrate-binding protein [Pseudomonas indica]PAU56501.1 glycine/betaine ABC transporter substrate-binding protein [Pseudomonas indica]